MSGTWASRVVACEKEMVPIQLAGKMDSCAPDARPSNQVTHNSSSAGSCRLEMERFLFSDQENGLPTGGDGHGVRNGLLRIFGT